MKSKVKYSDTDVPPQGESWASHVPFALQQARQRSTNMLRLMCPFLGQQQQQINTAKQNMSCAVRRLCMKMSSFLFTHGQCRLYNIYHVEFHFQFRGLVSFPA